jgi:hypothetical protein
MCTRNLQLRKNLYGLFLLICVTGRTNFGKEGESQMSRPATIEKRRCLVGKELLENEL